MFETEHDNWENVQEPVPRERTLGTRSNVVQCAWRERELRHKSLIMTSNIHFVWRSTDEAKLEHIREKRKKTFALRRKAIILITTLEISLLVITNLTSASSLKR